MPAKNKINLLPQEEFAASDWGRILSWALSTFRIAVIITELIVMAAFLSRFWLDARASDLNDLIKQKKAIILSSSDFEKKFRETQRRLKIFSALTTTNRPTRDTLNFITANLPADVFLSGFSKKADFLQIMGASGSEKNIVQFIVNLKSSGRFSEVSLISAETDSEEKTLLVFTLKLVPKGGKS